jgi:hypothetical protein
MTDPGVGQEDEFFNKLGTEVSPIADARRKLNKLSSSDDESRSISSASTPACWAQIDDIFYGVNKTHTAIPSGIYRPETDQRIGLILRTQKIVGDSLVTLPDSASEDILNEIKRFTQMKDKFTQYGFLHKTGILLWGPPGSGKTVAVAFLCHLLVEQEGGVALFADHPYPLGLALQMIRKIEPTRLIVVLFEDLDALVEKHGESEYLAILDGEARIDNVVFVATTNYPEKLDRRFVDRPSRFSVVRHIGWPSAAARRTFLLAKVPSLAENTVMLEELVRVSAQLSIDHLRELLVLTHCYGYDLDYAASRVRGMRSRPDSSKDSPFKSQPGFGSNGAEKDDDDKGGGFGIRWVAPARPFHP